MFKFILTSILTRELSPALIEEKGQKSYKLGKLFIFIGICALALLLLISLIVALFYSPYELFCYVLVFNTMSGVKILDWLVNTLVFVSYAGISLGCVGVPFYFYGINLYALGKIASNTEKK